MSSSTEIPKSFILIVDLFRFGEKLHTLSEHTRATDGQHGRPVWLQSIPVDDAVQKHCRASLEFKDNDVGHFAKTLVARCLTVADLS